MLFKNMKSINYLDILSEATQSKKNMHMFNDGKVTFRHIRDTLNDAFSNNVISFSKSVPVIQLYITSKDGKVFASTVKNVGKMVPISGIAELSEADDESHSSINKTLKNIAEALDTIDPILLNRYFANGKNCMKCSLICPPTGLDKQYGQKCFIKYDGIDCFDNKYKLIGSDKKTSFDLFKILKSCPCLDYEFSEITPEQICSIRKCKSEKTVLKTVIDQLSKLIDGIGWGCTLDYYINDRACRCIVNKALQHNLDISKNGSLVTELVARICGTSTRPTKSDLATFAKREGINVNSDNYKNFLDDIETISTNLSKEIIMPIDSILYYAISVIAKNIAAMISIDPNPKTKSFLSKISLDLFDAAESIEDCQCESDKILAIKNALSKLLKYIEFAPTEIRLMHGGRPYAIKQSIDKFGKLCEIIL